VINHWDTPDFREVKPRTVNLKSKARLFESETVILTPPFKARISWCFTTFNAPKKSIKRQMDAILDILQNLGVYLFQIGAVGFPAWKEGIRIVQAN
jgi:hypothetical protein